jgi:hypothetical protein
MSVLRGRTAKTKSKVTLWGLVRPARGVTKVSVERNTGKGYKRLKTLRTKRDGTWSFTSAAGTTKWRWQVVWKSPSGRTYTGAPTSAYTPKYPK